MKKVIGIVCFAMCLMLPGMALAYEYNNSGSFIGIFEGNDSNNWEELEAWLTKNDPNFSGELIYYDKIDAPSLQSEESKLDITYNQDKYGNVSEGGLYGGTWSTKDLTNYYGLKAGTQVAMFAVNPAEYTGTWSTLSIDAGTTAFPDTFLNNGNPIELSHFTASQSSNIPAVPEPSTLLLFAVGITALTKIKSRHDID